MKRKMEDLDTLMEDALALCRTPPVPPKHPHRTMPQQPHRTLPQYRKSLPPTPKTPKDETNPMEIDGAFTFEMELVPKPLFSRSITLAAEFFQAASVQEKSPSSSFSRSNTVPSRASRFATAEKSPLPLCSRQNSLPSNSRQRPARFASVEKSPLPLSSQEDARPPGLTHFAPVEPTSPMILSPAASTLGSPALSAASSTAPSLRSSNASITSSPPSTPGTSPPNSPYFHTPKFCAPPPTTCYFPPSTWIPPSPSPVYIPRHALRRKFSPRTDDLRGLRAKQDDTSQRVYDARPSTYLSGPNFVPKAPSGLKMVLDNREGQIKRIKS